MLILDSYAVCASDTRFEGGPYKTGAAWNVMTLRVHRNRMSIIFHNYNSSSLPVF